MDRLWIHWNVQCINYIWWTCTWPTLLCRTPSNSYIWTYSSLFSISYKTTCKFTHSSTASKMTRSHLPRDWSLLWCNWNHTSYKLLVDVGNWQIMDTLTQSKVQGITSDEPVLSPTLLKKTPSSPYETILSDFPFLTKPCNMAQPMSLIISRLQNISSLYSY